MSEATKIVTARLKIDGEAELKAQLNNIKSSMSTLGSELKKLAVDFDGQQNSLEALTKKHEILGKMLDEQKKKRDEYVKMLEKAQKAHEDAVKNYGAESDAAQKAANSVSHYQKEVNYAEIAVHKASEAVKNNQKYLDEASKSADGLAKSIDGAGKEFKKLGEEGEKGIDALAGALAAGGVAVAINEITKALRECVSEFSNFETSTAKVSTLFDGGDLEAYKQSIVNLSNETGKSVNELNEAVYQALSAGVDAAEAVNFVTESTRLAVAGFTDSAAAVDILTTVLNAYNISAEETERVASILVKTQDLGKTTVDELASNMGRAIPTAAAYNVSIENLSAGYAELTKNGINTRNATTYLSGMLDELASTSSKVAEILINETGKSFSELMDEGRSLGDVIEIIGNSVDGNATAFSNLWGQAAAGRAALTIFNGSATQFNDTLGQISNSTGAVARNFDIMANTTETAQNRMREATNNLKIAVGEQLAPAFAALTEKGTDTVKWATELIEKYEWLAPAITAITAAVGLFAGGMAVAVIAVKALNAAMALNPAIAVTMAIIGLTTAITVFAASADKTSAETRKLNNEMKALSETSRELVDAVRSSRDAFNEKIDSIDAEAESAAKLLDKIEELSAAEQNAISGSEEQLNIRKELAGTVDILNEALGETALKYNAETGAIEGNVAAIRSKVEAMRLEIQSTARKERAIELEKNLLDMQKKQAEAEKKIQEALQGTEYTREELQKACDDYFRALNSGDKEAILRTQVIKSALGDIGEELVNLVHEHNAFTNEINATNVEIGELVESIGDYSISVQESTEAVENHVSTLETWRETLDETIGSLDSLSDALAEQRENGELSLDTILDLIDAGYAAALAIDAETGAVYLNEEACLAMAQAKLEAEAATIRLALAEAQQAATAAHAAAQAAQGTAEYYNLAEAANEAAAQVQALQAALAGVEGISANLGSVGLPALGGSKRTSGGGGGGGSSKQSAPQKDDAYKNAKDELDYKHKMGLISTQEYYDNLAQLRDKHLTKDSAEWRRATLELLNVQEKLNKEYLDMRKAQINAELDLEKKRLNTIIDGVNAEIAARKKLKDSESDADRVKAAERALEEAKVQMKYARDDAARAEVEKLVLQRQAALDEVKNSVDEKLWLEQQQAKIDSAKEDIKKAEAAAQSKVTEASEQIANMLVAQTAALQAAAGSVSSVMNSYSTSNTANVNVSYNQASATTAQVAAIVRQVLESMG